MTFDEAFNTAARAYIGTEVKEPRTWLDWLRGRPVRRWKPTLAERSRVIEDVRAECKRRLREGGRLPTDAEMLQQIDHGFGPLTWLWIATTVVQLLAALKELWGDRE